MNFKNSLLIIVFFLVTSLNVLAKEWEEPLRVSGQLTVFLPDIVNVKDGTYKLRLSSDCNFLGRCKKSKFSFLSEASKFEIPMNDKSTLDFMGIRNFNYEDPNSEFTSFSSADLSLKVTFTVKHTNPKEIVIFKEVPKQCEKICTATEDYCEERDVFGKCTIFGNERQICTAYETHCTSAYEACLKNSTIDTTLIVKIIDLKTKSVAAKFESETRQNTSSVKIPMAMCFPKN